MEFEYQKGDVCLYRGERHKVLDANPPQHECRGKGPHVQIIKLTGLDGRAGESFVVRVEDLQPEAKKVGLFAHFARLFRR